MVNKFEIQPHHLPIFMTPQLQSNGAKSGIPGQGPSRSSVDVTEHAREGLLIEILYKDDLLLMSTGTARGGDQGKILLA